ncbi:MAG: phage virion morphogenesis protein [Brasilonema angustatum HA4187-MV1]|jgi:phage gpG-like protein|nr:phage virion morphogenesis protein [Brasilonema angustatum HA4187-MV1]
MDVSVVVYKNDPFAWTEGLNVMALMHAQAMGEIGEYQLKAVRDRFNRGVDSRGIRWVDLSPETWKRKGGRELFGFSLFGRRFGIGGTGRMLYQTGAMFNAIALEYKAWDEVIIACHDPKAEYHQFGTSTIPAREFIGVSEQDVDQHVKILDKWADKAAVLEAAGATVEGLVSGGTKSVADTALTIAGNFFGWDKNIYGYGVSNPTRTEW